MQLNAVEARHAGRKERRDVLLAVCAQPLTCILTKTMLVFWQWFSQMAEWVVAKQMLKKQAQLKTWNPSERVEASRRS